MAESDRIPPQAIEAEKAVLGSMLIEAQAIETALELLEEKYFYTKAHRALFRVFKDLYNSKGAADVVMATEELKTQGLLSEVGGSAYLTELMGTVATAAHVEHYARLVRKKAFLRELVEAATDIVGKCYGPDQDADQLLDEAQARVFSIAQKQTLHEFDTSHDLAQRVIEHLEVLHTKKDHLLGVSTGFSDLDRITSGFQKSELIIIAGRPSQGKTAFALNIAVNVATHKTKPVPVVIFSLEMDRMAIFMRMLCSEAKVDLGKTRSGYFSRADWPRLTSVGEKLAGAPIFIDSTPSLTIMDIRTRSRRLVSQLKSKGQEIGMIIIDYLQLLRGDYLSRKEGRQQEVSDISRQLKQLARDIQVPVVALSQLNRRTEEKGREGRPQLSDLRESGAIEQDADLVGFIFREEYYKREDASLRGKAEFIISKQRNGPVGTVDLRFTTECTRFDSLAMEADEVPAMETEAIL